MNTSNPQLRRLRQRKQEALDEIKAIRNEAATANVDLSDADRENIAGLEQIVGDYDDRIKRLEKILADELTAPVIASANGDGSKTTYPAPGSTPYPAPRLAKPANGSEWATRMFGHQATTGYSVSGFESVDEFLAVVKSERWDDRLGALQVSGQQEGSGAAGGFVVPSEYVVTSILGPAYEQSVCLQRCDTVSMTTEEKTVAGWDTSSASGGTLFGGFTPTIVGEGSSMTPQTGKVRKVKLKARKIGLLGKSSNEIEEDASALPQLMTTGLSTSVAHTLDYYCLWGDGASEPQGAMNADSIIEVSKEDGQQAASVVYSNLTKMLARLHPSLYNDAVWMASPTLVPWLFEMTVTVGTAGSFIPVLTSRDGQSEILLRPVIWSEKCKALGTAGDISLIAWSQYYIGLRKELTIEKSRHVYFESDETAWRAILRADGQPKWKEAYTPRNGDTLSWCVTLETRS